MKRLACWVAATALMICLTTAEQAAKAEGGYCIVVSKPTHDDPQWQPVVDALIVKHRGTVIVFEKAVQESLASLQKVLPRYVCFVAKPTEATREFVTEVNRLTRRIDEDPYSDAIWGILTGYDAACALRIARHKESLLIGRVAAGTEVELGMTGYTVPTWYGYGGWGLLDYFLEQPGRFTLAEAFFINQQALIHRLQTYFPGIATQEDWRHAVTGELPPQARQAGLTWNDARGLLYDRDNLAFYGDPAWIARMAPGPLSWEQTLTENDGEYRFEIRPVRGERSFATINANGSQRGGRPIIQLLPHHLQTPSVQIIEGTDLKPLVTSNFILVPNRGQCDPVRSYRVVFRAARMGS